MCDVNVFFIALFPNKNESKEIACICANHCDHGTHIAIKKIMLKLNLMTKKLKKIWLNEQRRQLSHLNPIIHKCSSLKCIGKTTFNLIWLRERVSFSIRLCCAYFSFFTIMRLSSVKAEYTTFKCTFIVHTSTHKCNKNHKPHIKSPILTFNREGRIKNKRNRLKCQMHYEKRWSEKFHE